MNIKKELEKSIPTSLHLTEQEKAKIRYRVRSSHPPTFQAKPVMVSILAVMLIVILLLPTLQSVEQSASNSESSITDEQVIENNSNELTMNHSPLSLTDEQKRQYHAQYVKIVEQAMEKKVGISIAVSPIDEFKEEYWVEPKEFEQRIQSMVDEHLATEREKIRAMSTTPEQAVMNGDGNATKLTYIYFSDILRKIEVTGHFETQYSAYHDRQLFIVADDISTQLANSSGTWEQTSYQASLIDGGRTYRIRIEGIFDLNNITYEKAFTIEFRCDEFGKIY
ncbi:hypothetical protein AAGS61_04625 [Lysinibacillus sp. KU-BSD001]|uniref:hypothetical protein n=1 Tax=Lysinibacillus sp. KU-BSD001 TaxID=3141328 RepID=UPI0036E59548